MALPASEIVGHGGFFEDNFVTNYWLPWFRSGNFVKSKAPPRSGTRWHLLTIIQIKWVAILLCVLCISWLGMWWFRPRSARLWDDPFSVYPTSSTTPIALATSTATPERYDLSTAQHPSPHLDVVATPGHLPTASPIVFLPAPDAAPGEPSFEDLSSTPSGTGVSSIGYSLDGQFAVVCARSEGATVWRRTSKGLLDLRSRLPGWAMEVKFNSTGNAFIAGSGVRKLQFPSDSTIQLLNPIPEHPVHSIAISFDETKAVWIEPSREPLVQAGPQSGLPLPRPETQVDFLGEIGLFDLVGNHESWRITTMTPILPTIYFLNGNECAVTSNCLHILDLTTKLMTPYQPCTHILTVLQKEATGVMNDSTNEWMKMGTKSIAPAGSAVIFDTIEGGASCYSCAISPGNKALAAVVDFSDGRRAILVWDLTTRKRVREWTCPGALAVAWSPLDGQLLVGGVRILRLYRFKEIAHD